MNFRHVMEPSVTESLNHFTTLPGSGGVPGTTWGLTNSASHAWKTLILPQVQLAVPGCRKAALGFSGFLPLWKSALNRTVPSITGSSRFDMYVVWQDFILNK